MPTYTVKYTWTYASIEDRDHDINDWDRRSSKLAPMLLSVSIRRGKHKDTCGIKRYDLCKSMTSVYVDIKTARDAMSDFVSSHSTEMSHTELTDIYRKIFALKAKKITSVPHTIVIREYSKASNVSQQLIDYFDPVIETKRRVTLTSWRGCMRMCPHPMATKTNHVGRRYEIDLDLIHEVAAHYDVMLVTRNGKLIGFYDEKGKRFRKR